MNFSKHQQQQQSVYANSQFTNERSNEKHSHMHAVRGSSVEQAAIYSLFANTTVECEFHSCAFNRIQKSKMSAKMLSCFSSFFPCFLLAVVAAVFLFLPPFSHRCTCTLYIHRRYTISHWPSKLMLLLLSTKRQQSSPGQQHRRYRFDPLLQHEIDTIDSTHPIHLHQYHRHTQQQQKPCKNINQ